METGIYGTAALGNGKIIITQRAKYGMRACPIIVRMAKVVKRLQAILDYMKNVKLITSTVFGQFS